MPTLDVAPEFEFESAVALDDELESEFEEDPDTAFAVTFPTLETPFTLVL